MKSQSDFILNELGYLLTNGNTSCFKHDLVFAIGATTSPEPEEFMSIVLSYHHYSRENNLTKHGDDNEKNNFESLLAFGLRGEDRKPHKCLG